MTPPPHTHSPATAGASALVLSGPSALIAGLPYLLGFEPQESTVLVWIREGRVFVTQRLDAAAFEVDADRWSSVVWGHQGAAEAEEVIVIHVGRAPAPQALVDVMQAEAASRGVAVRDVLSVVSGRWRSQMCRDEECCPSQGRPVDPQMAAAVAAEFTILGVAPRADREDLVAELAETTLVSSDGADTVHARTERLRAARPSRRRDLESWRDHAIERILTDPDAWSASDVDEVVAALADVRVRDTILWDCAHLPAERLVALLGALQACTRSAPTGFVAPVATCTAVIAWLLGDGARAGIALDRALSDRADYSLALLVRHAIATGMPPGTWRRVMAEVSRAECRHGRD